MAKLGYGEHIQRGGKNKTGQYIDGAVFPTLTNVSVIYLQKIHFWGVFVAQKIF